MGDKKKMSWFDECPLTVDEFAEIEVILYRCFVDPKFSLSADKLEHLIQKLREWLARR